MLRKILSFIGICIIWSNSFVFANYLDDAFKGNILIVGGVTKNDPNKLSINISGDVDIIGNGWNDKLIAQLTPGKYEHVLFEHVGMSLYRVYKDDELYKYVGVATAYYQLLKPGGSFDFLTWGYFLDEDLAYYLRTNTTNRPVYQGIVLSYNFSNDVFVLEKKPSHLNEQLEAKLLELVKKNAYIIETVRALGNAGFVDIKMQGEEEGILGFTKKHGSLHISARKSK